MGFWTLNWRFEILMFMLVWSLSLPRLFRFTAQDVKSLPNYIATAMSCKHGLRYHIVPQSQASTDLAFDVVSAMKWTRTLLGMTLCGPSPKPDRAKDDLRSWSLVMRSLLTSLRLFRRPLSQYYYCDAAQDIENSGSQHAMQ